MMNDLVKLTDVKTKVLTKKGANEFTARTAAGALNLDMTLDPKSGMPKSADFPMGPQTAHIERVYESGGFNQWADPITAAGTQAFEALRASEELHRATFSNISDAVFMADDAGKFTFVCPNVDVIFGFTPDEVFAVGRLGAVPR